MTAPARKIVWPAELTERRQVWLRRHEELFGVNNDRQLSDYERAEAHRTLRELPCPHWHVEPVGPHSDMTWQCERCDETISPELIPMDEQERARTLRVLFRLTAKGC